MNKSYILHYCLLHSAVCKNSNKSCSHRNRPYTSFTSVLSMCCSEVSMASMAGSSFQHFLLGGVFLNNLGRIWLLGLPPNPNGCSVECSTRWAHISTQTQTWAFMKAYLWFSNICLWNSPYYTHLKQRSLNNSKVLCLYFVTSSEAVAIYKHGTYDLLTVAMVAGPLACIKDIGKVPQTWAFMKAYLWFSNICLWNSPYYTHLKQRSLNNSKVLCLYFVTSSEAVAIYKHGTYDLLTVAMVAGPLACIKDIGKVRNQQKVEKLQIHDSRYVCIRTVLTRWQFDNTTKFPQCGLNFGVQLFITNHINYHHKPF